MSKERGFIPNFSFLETYVENSIICPDFWDSISHPGGQPSVISMNVLHKIKKGITD